MKGTEQPPREAGGQEGTGRKWGKEGGRLWPRVWGGQKETLNPPWGPGWERGDGRLGHPRCLGFARYLFIDLPVPEGPGGNATGPGLPGAPRTSHPAPAPRSRYRGRHRGLARCGRRRPGAHPRLLSGGHPSPSPSRLPGRGAYGPAGCSAGLRAGKATAPGRRRAEPTRPSAPWTRCPARPP